MFIQIFTALYVVYYVTTYFLNKSRYPKGPMPLPIVGNFPQIAFEMWKCKGIVNALISYKKKYGKMYTLWFGPMPTVHIVDYDLAKEQMVKHGSDYTNRFTPKIQLSQREGLGIVLNDGPVWLEHRRFALQTLRNFGLGKNVMETIIMEEFNHRVNQIKTSGKEYMNAVVFFDVLVGNVINQLLFAERFPEDSKEFWEMKKMFEKQIENLSIFDALAPFWLMESPLLNWRFKRIQEPDVYAKNFIKKKVDRRMDQIRNGNRNPSEDAKDFTDAYFRKMEEDKEAGVETTFTVDHLIIDLVDLWGAGQETTTSTLTWAAALLLKNPEYIEKIYQEVLEVTNGERHLGLADRAATPLLNATIHETQRHASLVNLNFFRRTVKEQIIEEYRIPAGVPITAQISVIMADNEFFVDSDKFDPTRYLKDEHLTDRVLPFGMGKRACLGEALARAELYLILGNFLLNYDLKPHGRLPETTVINDTGVFKAAPQFECSFVPRK